MSQAAAANRYRHADAQTVAQFSVFFTLLGALALAAIVGYFAFCKPLLQAFLSG